jgi:hypothetical protein
MTRAAPLGLLVASLGAVDVGLYLGLPIAEAAPTGLGSLVPLLVLPLSVASGFAYGSLLATRVTRSLERTGVFRATRRRLVALLIVIVLTVAVYFWSIDLVLTILRPLAIGVFSLLASMFAAQSIVYMKWERRTGKRVEYEGAWGVKAVDNRLPPSTPIVEQQSANS